MLTRPVDLSDLEVIAALRTGWSLETLDVEYLAVGFGSHHWRATDDAGRRWFVSVDDLAARRCPSEGSTDVAYERLGAALLTALAIHESGAAFVVAPLRTIDGGVLQRVGDQYAAALYPFVDGRHREFGDTLTAVERDDILRLIGALHTLPAVVSRTAQVEDFVLAQRAELVNALNDVRTRWDTGPYGERARSWLAVRESRIEHLLGEHEQLADQARDRPDRMVLTHGEPHSGNLIKTTDGWMLVDWDTVLIGPPERDLWLLRGPEGSTFDAYINTAGRDVLVAMTELYRITWELGDVASFAARFHRAHDDTADARYEWANLQHRTL
jgi:hypothetical protein